MSSVEKELPKPKLLRMTAESTAEIGLKVLFALGFALGLESPGGSPTVRAETGTALRKVASLRVSCAVAGKEFPVGPARSFEAIHSNQSQKRATNAS